MLTWMAVAAQLAAVGIVARWWARRYDELGRRREPPVISVCVLVLVGIVAALPVALRHEEESRLSRAASAIVGRHVTVHCQDVGAALVDMGSELGYVRFSAAGVPEHQTLIKRQQCQDLSAYLDGGWRHPSAAEIEAVHVLTHESMHMSGITNEAGAECAAVQRDADMARLLGASPERAAALASAYWRVDYPNMPDDYRSRDCHPGGSLDEHLADAPW